jgi:hypothetical protein
VRHTPLGALPRLGPVLADLEIQADIAAALEVGPRALLEGAGDGPGAAAGEVHVAEGAHVGVGRVGGCLLGGGCPTRIPDLCDLLVCSPVGWS